MTNVYQEKPNVVTVGLSDKTGTAERFVVGKTLDEVLAILDPGSAASVVAAPTKGKRHRRTKAELAAVGSNNGKAENDSGKKEVWP